MNAKTQEEIDILREGGRNIARTLQTLQGMVKASVTGKELEMKARELTAADGDEAILLGFKYDPRKPAFHSALCVSVNDTMVHSPGVDGDVRIDAALAVGL